jgi:hypothetical protein
MIDISTELQEAFKANTREIHAEVTLNFSDITIDPSVEAFSAKAISPDLTSQIILGNTVTSCKWASMDGISDMAGTYCMQPVDENDKINQVGFWSDEITDVSGVIDTEYSITSAPRNISRIAIYGDNARQEYPVDLTLEFYDGGGLVATENIVGNTLIEIDYELTTELSDITRVDITVTKYSTPGTNVKILATLTSLVKTYTGTDIIDFTTTEESEISNNNSIPTGNISYSKCDLTLVNRNRQFDINNASSPLFGAIKPNSKLDIKLGARTSNGIELFPFFSGWTGGFNAPENSLDVTTTAFDRIERLRLTIMSPQEVQINQTAGDIATLILNDAGISAQFINIDSRLFTSVYELPIYFIEGTDHLSELKRLSEAIAGSVYSVSDVIYFESVEALSFKVDTVESYGLSDYTDKTNQALYDTLINTIKVNYSPFILGGLEEQYKTTANSPDTIAADGETTLRFNFKNKSCVDHVLVFTPPAGVTVVNEDYYSDRALITFDNTNLAPINLTVEIQAKSYEANLSREFILTDVDSELNYGKSEFTYPDNDLIQSLDLADTIGEYLLGSYKDPFRDVTLQLSNAGNPAISLTDKIEVIDRYTEKRYNVVSKNTTYNGGLSMVLKARIATLKDFNLFDNLDNQIVDNLGNSIIVLNTDTQTTSGLIDNLNNTVIDNQGRTITIRSN